MNIAVFFKRYFGIIILLLAPVFEAGAQSLLEKKVSVEVINKPLAEVLKLIGRQGDFIFSYNSNIIPEGKQITLSAKKESVRSLLDKLLTGLCTYKESGNYIILQPLNEKWYTVSGYVLDARSGTALTNASVYERQQLISTLTNEEGFFKLKLRDKYPIAQVVVSKEMYLDTAIVFTAGGDQMFHLPVTPIHNVLMNDVVITNKNNVPDSWLARLFLSSNLKSQTRNIAGYIANRPIQASFIPGLGTHGRLSGQVVNKFSLNILGGYTAGAKGVEVGGVFNIDKDRVDGAQVAGVFNLVGGKTKGVQVAGVYNRALDSVDGVQVSGVLNSINGSANGIVVAGVYNDLRGEMKGTQISGVANYTSENVGGTQIAGVGNIVRGAMNGVQMAGVFNYAKTVNGIQAGIINLSDSCNGYMFGLFNITRNGYHKVSLLTNDLFTANISFKTGNANLYTIFTGGLSFSRGDKAYAFGLGLGKDFHLSKHLTITTEATMQHIYLGRWDNAHFLYRFMPNLTYRFNRFFSIYAGPSLSMYESQPTVPVQGYRYEVVPGNEPLFTVGTNLRSWIGWQFGITLF